MRILFLSHFVPYPPTDGASLRNYNLIRGLSAAHEVHLLTFHQRVHQDNSAKLKASAEAMQRYCADLEILGLPTDRNRLLRISALGSNLLFERPFSAQRFRCRRMMEAIRRRVRTGAFDIVHVDTVALWEYLDCLGNVPSVLNHHNVESALLRRRAATERNRLIRSYLALQARKVLEAERQAINRFDGNIAVSEVDAEELRAIAGGGLIRVIPNGTDTDYFAPSHAVSETTSVVFVGSMSWYPNRDAMGLFAREIWPIVRREIPNVQMNLVGAHPPAELIALGKRDPGFRVLGYVDDARPFMDKAAVYVVPIRVGGGTRLKILDAMAKGKAIVSHPVGAEGLAVTDGVDIVIAGDPQAFARRIIELIRDPARRAQLGTRARQTALRLYSWSSVVPRLSEFYDFVAATRTRRCTNPGA